MEYVARDDRGKEIRYRDRKRYWWLLSVALPSLPFWAAVGLWTGGSPAWAFLPLGVGFGLIPLLDLLFGEDPDNPPEAALEAMAADPWYRALLFASVAVSWASFAAAAVAASAFDLSAPAFLALALGTGATSGAALTVGHELGHKGDRAAQLGAKLANALTGYAHFTIEHNRGHHAMVATPEDPASARMGESVWRFALREIPGAARRAWRLERERLARQGLAFWHWRNDLLQGYAISAAVAAMLIAAFGPRAILFLTIHHPFGWLQLTFANYVEHYGLLRDKRADGRYGPCEPRHSWNTNHIVSNLALFHLQRHSDHHANPLRPYQALRDFPDLPRLPSGYPGSFLLAAAPPLWFATMDRKVLAWAGGDMTRVNRQNDSVRG
jgi:alkane 1-monooxygenase